MFLILLFMTYVTILGADQFVVFRDDLPMQCVPRSIFRYDHNICECDENGAQIICKRKMYTTLFPELMNNQLQNLTISCVPGQKVFDIQCHRCVCDDNTNYATCVRLPCASKNNAFNKRDECIPGSIVRDKCNGCICGPDGKAVCTNIDCLAVIGGKNIKPDVACPTGVTHKVGCNECGCGKDGMTISCDRMKCHYPTFFHEHLLNVTMSCQPTSNFDYNCHKCVCSIAGTHAMCAGVECPGYYKFTEVEDTVEKCNPGMIFANACNICICGENGKGVCTTMRCDIAYYFKYVKDYDG